MNRLYRKLIFKLSLVSIFIHIQKLIVLIQCNGDVCVTLILLIMGVNISEFVEDSNSTKTEKMWNGKGVSVSKCVMAMALVMLLLGGILAAIMFFTWNMYLDIDIIHYMVPLFRRLALWCLMFRKPPPDK